MSVSTVLPCSVVAAEYQFEILEFPGADYTIAQGINNHGVVVGIHSSDDDEFPLSGGYIWRDGVFTPEDFGFVDVILSGVNDSGLVVGTGLDFETFSSPVFTAPLSGDVESIETFEVPDAFLALSGGINNAGDFVGAYFGEIGSFHAFTAIGDSVNELTLPGYSEIFAADINDAGQIVGGAINADNEQVGFILDKDELTIVQHPDGDTELLAINNSGAIAGAVFTEDSSKTFIYDGVQFEDFIYPGVGDVVIWDMNDHGVVVGQIFADSGEIGFVATPVPEPTEWTLSSYCSCWPVAGARDEAKSKRTLAIIACYSADSPSERSVRSSPGNNVTATPSVFRHFHQTLELATVLGKVRLRFGFFRPLSNAGAELCVADAERRSITEQAGCWQKVIS